MSEIRTYRGSEAPLAMLCAGSVNPDSDEILIDTVNPAGTVGTVVHKICEEIVKTGAVPANWEDTCRSYGLDAAQIKEVGFLIFAAHDCWQTYGIAFKSPMIEWSHEEDFAESDKYFVVSVHEDVADVADNEGVILDWKSTRLDLDYTAQVMIYAWMLFAAYPNLDHVTTILVFLRDRTVNIRIWTPGQIHDFADRFVREVVNWDGHTYRPGGHCAYCRRFTSCPARQALVKHTIAELDDLPTTGLVEFHQRVQVVSALVEKAKAQVRAAVEQAGGELVAQDGQRLALVPAKRDNIDARKAWPIIEPELTMEQLAGCTEIKKGELMKAIAANAPRGKKKEAKELIMERLEKAGALNTTEFSQLRLLQAKSETKEIEIGRASETE